MGAARTHRRRRAAKPGSRQRDRLSAAPSASRRTVARIAIHCDGVPTRVLPALSRLSEILPALGASALRQSRSIRSSSCSFGHVSVIAVTGLAVEARIAAGPGVRTIVGGGNAKQLIVALDREIGRGASALMSFGIAGGLTDGLTAGTWLVARRIVNPTATWEADAAWTRAISLRLVGALTVDIAGVDSLVPNPQAKQALRRTSGAAAVDTESHIVAGVAAAHRLPFVAFRVVADSVRRTLPPAVHVALRKDGKI